MSDRVSWHLYIYTLIVYLCLLQGGDGLVGREVLKHNVKSVHLVDLDPAMTELFGEEGPEKLQVSEFGDLTKTCHARIALLVILHWISSSHAQRLNGYSLSDRRMTVHNMDAKHFIGNYSGEKFQIIIMDLPDPNLPILATMYSREFFQGIIS